MKYEYITYSDKGPRNENQDFLRVGIQDENIIACVADGVGGSNCGSKASQLSVNNYFKEITNGNLNLSSILKRSHELILENQILNPDCVSMATTFTGCYIKSYNLQGVHVGDSTLSIIRGNGIKQLTEDQTEAKRFLKEGKLSPEEYKIYPRKNILYSALGIKGMPEIQPFKFTLEKNDKILLATDGLHSIIKKVEIRNINLNNTSNENFVNSLVDLINSRQLTDNTSFISIQIL